MRSSKLAIASAALLSVLSPAGAQDPGAIRQGGAATAGQAMMCRAYERVEGQLAYIKTELRITAAQEPQWNVFANVFRANKEKQYPELQIGAGAESLDDVRQLTGVDQDQGRSLERRARGLARAGRGATATLCEPEQGAEEDRRRDIKRSVLSENFYIAPGP